MFEKDPPATPEDESASLARQMSERISQMTSNVPVKRSHPFRSAILRGLAVIMPPLLTIVIFLWIAGTVKSYVIDPLFNYSRYALIYATSDIVRQKDLPARGLQSGKPGSERVTLKNGKEYHRVADGTYVPTHVYQTVSEGMELEAIPATGIEIYHRYVEFVYLRPHIFIPVVFVAFVFLVYVIGKLIANRLGHYFWRLFENCVERVPLVSNVYGAVKKVCDFFFAENEMRFSRVVALEWPRRGIWALALVTGEGLFDLEDHAGEPFYSVLVPTSPMPATGFTLNVPKSDTLELSITVDQAIQFIVSCGVVVPVRNGKAGAEDTEK